jgi:rod shape-determining protein MreD
MKVVLISLVCLAMVAVECAILHPFGLSIARADVHVAIVLFLALRCQTLEGTVGSFMAGYLVDSLSGEPSGLYVFSSVLTFLLARLLAPFVEVRSVKGFVFLAGAVDLLHNLSVLGLSKLLAVPGVSQGPSFLAIWPTAGLTMAAALLAWPLLRAIETLFKKPESGLLL